MRNIKIIKIIENISFNIFCDSYQSFSTFIKLPSSILLSCIDSYLFVKTFLG